MGIRVLTNGKVVKRQKEYFENLLNEYPNVCFVKRGLGRVSWKGRSIKCYYEILDMEYQ